ncbi:unnamed protein product [Rotaria sordida]|nr:unnamed protein product [Rotaria sordida]CAF1261713.1 unnamed protein product [Rotaria sordida]
MIQMELLKKQEKPNNLLVLDDGGCFYEALTILFAINDNLIEPNKLFDNLPLSLRIFKFDIKLILSYLDSIEIRLVEQTSRAFLNMLSYLFYDAKSHLTNRKPSKFDKCLLVGYGAIGEAVAYALIHKGDLGLFLKDLLYI